MNTAHGDSTPNFLYSDASEPLDAIAAEPGAPVRESVSHMPKHDSPNNLRDASLPIAGAADDDLDISEIRLRLAAVQRAALSDKVVMSEYVGALRTQIEKLSPFREAHDQYVSQMEEHLAALQLEAAEIEALIDIVQSSRFWRLKRWMRRMQSRLTGRR